MTRDLLDEIKNKWNIPVTLPMSVPWGKDDVVWLVQEVERLRAEAKRADEEATKLANSDLATTEQVIRALRAENERLRDENDPAEETCAEPSLGPADNYAGAWLRGFRSAIEAAGLPWYPPHVAGSDEEISLEWWRGNRKLTVFVRGFEVEVLSVSGPNMNTDINTLYRVDQPEEAVRVWRWLRGE